MIKLNYSGLQTGDILKSGVFFYLVVNDNNQFKKENLIPCKKIFPDILEISDFCHITGVFCYNCFLKNDLIILKLNKEFWSCL